MIKGLTVKKTVRIHADSLKVWGALTDPEKIKQYLFGTNAISDWKEGSPIVFQGEYQGRHYRDKGNVLAVRPGKLMQYDYWSGFSGLEDKPENYSVVRYDLESEAGQTILTLTQQGFASEQARDHSDSSWEMVLEKMKKIIEGTTA